MAFHFRRVFCPSARLGGVLGTPLAGSSRFLSLGGPLLGSLRGVRAPPGASAIARSLPGRRDPARTLRPRRDRAVTAVTAVTAVIAVIAGITLLGPVRVARTVAKGAMPPVFSVPAVTTVTLPDCHSRTVGTCICVT
jgi:hypothetical protein